MTDRKGRCYRYKDLVYYAYNGLVAMEDERDGSWVVILPDDIDARADALEQILRRTPQSRGVAYERDLYRETKNTINDMRQCAKEARDMGDPSDPLVQAFNRRHRPGPKSISLRGGADPAGYPELPTLPRGRYTGRTASPDVSMPVQGLRVCNRIRKPPRRRSQLILP